MVKIVSCTPLAWSRVSLSCTGFTENVRKPSLYFVFHAYLLCKDMLGGPIRSAKTCKAGVC
jgi:hypothetical protein